MGLGDFVMEEDLSHTRDVFSRVLDRQPQQLELTIKHVTGRPVEVAVTAVPWVVDDDVRGVFGICEDVTERNRVQRELELVRQLAATASEAKSDFVARMSHEIRTPLTSILATTELLTEDEPEEEKQALLNTLHRAGTRLLRLVDGVLDFGSARADTARGSETFDLVELIEAVGSQFAAAASSKGIAFEQTVDDGVPRFVRGHPHWTAQILQHLLRNAVEFTDAGGVEMTATLSRGDDVSTIRFVVSDTGVGIAKDRLAAIFEPFVSLSPAGPASQRSRAGLGLSVVQELAVLCGARVGVESEPGRGSRFTVNLPVSTV